MNEFFTQVIFSLSKFSQSLSGLNLQKPSGAVLAVLFFVVVVFLIAFSLGKTRILLAILSTYIALFLLVIFPFVFQVEKFFGNWTGLPAVFWTRSAVFVLFFIISLAVLNGSILKPRMSIQESSPFTILFLSILEAGFLVSSILSFWDSASHSAFKISPLLLQYFGTENTQFIWAVLPLLAMIFLRRKKVV